MTAASRPGQDHVTIHRPRGSSSKSMIQESSGNQGEPLKRPSPSTSARIKDAESASISQPYCALTRGRRRFVLGIVTAAGFLGPLAGAIYLPALPVLEREFHVGETSMNATVSVFMVVFAFGPLVWSGFADFKGRRPLYIISLAIYVLSNVLIASIPKNFGALLFLRILQAFGSSSAISMGAGTVADTTDPNHRGTAISVFLLGPQCGPILGPVLGGIFAGETSWRWMFGFLAISGLALWLAIIFMLPETLRYRVGNGELHSSSSWLLMPPRIASPVAAESKRGPKPPRPTLLGYWKLFGYPPIGIVSFNTAILYSTYFAIAVQLPHSLESIYHWSTTEVGGGYIAMGIAMVAGSLVGGRANDWRRAKLVKASEGGLVGPEGRLVDQIWGVFVCAAGTLMFGWLVDQSIHAAAVLFATFLTGFGMSWVFVGTAAFLSECVPQQAASAFALGNMLRNPGAAIVAVILPPLVSKMGVGWFFTGLALLDLVLVGATLILLRIRAPHWRETRKP